MCRILNTRKTDTTVYIELDDGMFWGVKKMSLADFEFAKSFHNMDFLGEVGQWTNDRDFKGSAAAVPFIDPMISYSE